MTAAEDSTPDPPVLLAGPAGGIPPIVANAAELATIARTLAALPGPVALDAERASGYRYSQRAYLIQIRRGDLTVLIDPILTPDLTTLATALADSEWVIHAASQDLACLREVGLIPTVLFDTELAARLLNFERVGLAALAERELDVTLAKEHSAADWSIRPIPQSWLNYAALDVELLVELRDRLTAQLAATGKAEWARQEFAHVMASRPPTQPDRWRRTSGIHQVKSRSGLAVVRELWVTRDQLANELDIAQSRLLPDSSIVVAALADPAVELTTLKGFVGRAARRYRTLWSAARIRALALPTDDLPPVAAPLDGPPPPRVWARQSPAAAARLAAIRAALQEKATELDLPVEQLLAPGIARGIAWDPPPAQHDAVTGRLAAAGARPWQQEACAPILTAALATD